MGKSKVKMQGVMGREEALAHLEGVVDNLRRGTLTLSRGDDRVSLTLAEVVEFKLKGDAKGDEERLSLELCWKRTPVDPGVSIGGDWPGEAA